MPAPRADDPFMTLTDIKKYLRMDTKTIKKLAHTKGLPLIELTPGKKGAFRSALDRWITDLHTEQDAA
jgi:hypothetical protein